MALEALLSSPGCWQQTADPLRARMVNVALSKASISARQFVGMEFRGGNDRLVKAWEELHGPTNFGRPPLRNGSARAR